MSGFTQIDRNVLAWATVLVSSSPAMPEHTLALRELVSLSDDLDRMHTGEMAGLNACVMELGRRWKPGEPVSADCIDYVRLALVDFHVARQRRQRMS